MPCTALSTLRVNTVQSLSHYARWPHTLCFPRTVPLLSLGAEALSLLMLSKDPGI